MVYDSLISTHELYKNLENPDWVVIDCHFILSEPHKGWKAYQKEHIPGALYAHLNEDLSGRIIAGKTGRHPLPGIEEFSRTASNWGIDESVQVVAYDDSGGKIAARLWWLLKWLGHDAVAVLDGGLKAWKKAGYPLEKTIKPNPPRKFKPSPQMDLIVNLSKYGSEIPKDMIIIDSRAPERFTGKIEPIDPVAGRIPGAINIFYQNNLEPDERFKVLDELKSEFSSQIKTPSEYAVFYCGSGVTAAHNILAMYAAGLGLARLYPGSWSDWINDPERPIEKD